MSGCAGSIGFWRGRLVSFDFLSDSVSVCPLCGSVFADCVRVAERRRLQREEFLAARAGRCDGVMYY